MADRDLYRVIVREALAIKADSQLAIDATPWVASYGAVHGRLIDADMVLVAAKRGAYVAGLVVGRSVLWGKEIEDALRWYYDDEPYSHIRDFVDATVYAFAQNCDHRHAIKTEGADRWRSFRGDVLPTYAEVQGRD